MRSETPRERRLINRIGRALHPLVGLEVEARVLGPEGASLALQQGTLEQVRELRWAGVRALLLEVGGAGHLRIGLDEASNVESWSVDVDGCPYAVVSVSLRSGAVLTVAESFDSAFL